MDSSENQHGQDPNPSDSDPRGNPGFSNWRSQENLAPGSDSEHDSQRSNSTHKRTGTRTTTTSIDDSDLDYIQDRLQQIEVSPGPLQSRKRKYDGRFVSNFVEYFSDYESWQSSATFGSNTESPKMKDQATDVFDLKLYERPRKKIKACRLESRMRRMSFKKHKAYKKNLRCSSEAASIYQHLRPNCNMTSSKKNEVPKTNIRKRKRKIRRSEKPFAESSEESSGETSS